MRHRDFSTWLAEIFPFKVQKISIDAGFSCPNRDGKIYTGGCTFCNNRTFNPSYCSSIKEKTAGTEDLEWRKRSVITQLDEGKRFFSRKYQKMKYLAYFQAYTNTYAPLEQLRQLYEAALSVSDVVGIVIGTRPDCVSEDLLCYLEELSHRTFVLLEFGIESANDDTLRRIHRGHDFACSRHAIERAHTHRLYTGGHVILGLPGENHEESLRQAPVISSLPLDVLKIHQLQIVKGTQMARDYLEKPFPLYSVEEYLLLVVDYIRLLRDDLVLERFVSQCPPELLIAPRWGIKNYQFTQMLKNYLQNHRIDL